jgi:hypothetical protein
MKPRVLLLCIVLLAALLAGSLHCEVGIVEPPETPLPAGYNYVCTKALSGVERNQVMDGAQTSSFTHSYEAASDQSEFYKGANFFRLLVSE